MVRVYSDVRTRLVETKSKLDMWTTNTHRVSQHLIDRTLEVVMLKHLPGDDPNLELCRSALEITAHDSRCATRGSRLRSELIDAINKVPNVLPQ